MKAPIPAVVGEYRTSYTIKDKRVLSIYFCKDVLAKIDKLNITKAQFIRLGADLLLAKLDDNKLLEKEVLDTVKWELAK